MKNFKELKTIEEVQREFPEGTKVRCKIYGTNIKDAEIHYDNSEMYILQDTMDGNICDTTKNYKYSWLTFDNEGWVGLELNEEQLKLVIKHL